MSRANGLIRVNDHGPGHPLAWIVWSVPAFFFLYEYILRIMPGIIEKDLEHEFHIDEATIGGSLGMYYFAYAPMQLVVGILLDRFGARVLLAGAAVICAMGLIVFSMSSTTWGLAGSRFLVGFGSSFAFIGAVYVAMVWFPEKQIPLLTGLTAGLGFGIGIVGELFTTDILGTPPAWRSASLILAIIGMLVAVGVLIVVPHRPAWYLDRTGIDEGRTMKRAMHGLLEVMSRPAIWLISLGCALMYLPLPLAANWGPRTVSELIGRSDMGSSELFAWFYLGVAAGCPLSGWLSSRIGRTRPILLAGAACICGLTITLALLSNPSQTEIAMILLAWGAATSTYVLGYPLAAELCPRDAHGSAIAFVNFVAMMLAFGYVWLFGVVVDAFASSRGHIPHAEPGDFQSTLLWTGVLVGLAVILVGLVRSHRPKTG
ncbi:MAG: MFS transporter [Phycisphaerales bacterium]|nr:MFS transporter [Phycisphaerales bacterium]